MESARIIRSSSFLLILFSINGVISSNRQPLDGCSILGNWQDQGSVPNSQLMFRIQQSQQEDGGLFALALTPNPQWGTGRVTFDSSSNAISVLLDSLDTIKGTVSGDCSNITWSVPAGAMWLRVPQPDNVHVVFMNHLDVGYASFIGNIINEYFDNYFPRAVTLGKMAEVYRKGYGFIYTSHPWLVSMYLDCPPNLMFNGIPIHCPDADALAAFKDAIVKGYIAWHAGPMNMQVEFMDDILLNAGLDIAETLDARFNKTPSTVLSQRDVPGITAAAIPVLTKRGIKGVSVGVNPSSAPPAVPKIFRWQFKSNDNIIGMWHPGGYPVNPGSDLRKAGGISVRDCTVAPGTSHALCFAFRTDNTGPPTSLEELDSCYQIIREEFPEATVFASTLDNFIANVNASNLPVVNNEIGDNWIQGISSDPLKSSKYRAAARGFTKCMANNDCDTSDPQVFNATRFLIKLPEHTWGLSGIDDTDNWSNSDFEKARNSLSSYKDNENSWREQRVCLDLALEASKGHKLHDYIMQSLQDTEVVKPDLSKYKAIDPSSIIELGNGKATIGFNTSVGSINQLTCQSAKGKLVFATNQNQLGVFTYHSYNDTDYSFMNSHYGYYGNAGYSKPGSEVANPESKAWPVKLIKAYQSKSDPSSFLMQLAMADNSTHINYGAPEYIWIAITVVVHLPNEPVAITLEYDMTIVNKTPTRLPEATMFSFYPSLSSGWTGYLGKVFGYELGRNAELNVGSVVKNGTQYQHAVQYVRMAPLPAASRAQQLLQESMQANAEQRYSVLMNSTHVPLVCPITDDGRTPTPFPAPLDPIPNGIITGMAFNIHNNVWNTNYPLYYPFNDEDANFRAKFNVAFYPQ